jgi:site-specific DNA-methyltransferase (adenine-specific)
MIQGNSYTLHIGNNLDILPTLPDNSVDSIVTDPPYELGFMGKKWDSSGIAYSVELWTQCLRVLKPGGHLLSFGGTRTWHRVAVAIEDAGFEVRDSIAWMYGSGFPKSLDVSKAIDKAAGVEREVIGTKIASPKGISGAEQRSDSAAGAYGGEAKEIDITAPSTAEAKQWEGWGTALKPAFEPIVVARKPLIGTVAENVLTYGTGGLNIDGSRIATDDNLSGGIYSSKEGIQDSQIYNDPRKYLKREDYVQPSGRWPANVILDEYTAELLDEQSGVSKSPAVGSVTKTKPRHSGSMSGAFNHSEDGMSNGYGDTGGASRFFYVAKASKRDRNEGLEELPLRHAATGNVMGGDGDTMLTGSGNPRDTRKQNFHPTVKPTDLMRYLIKLVTPPGGTVLDPFTGSGSTGKAAILEGFTFIGCELTEDYIPIIEGRLKHAEAMAAEAEAKKDEALF